jgi:hypothetical protein
MLKNSRYFGNSKENNFAKKLESDFRQFPKISQFFCIIGYSDSQCRTFFIESLLINSGTLKNVEFSFAAVYLNCKSIHYFPLYNFSAVTLKFSC